MPHEFALAPVYRFYTGEAGALNTALDPLKRVRRESNPRPAALETAALPAELHTLKESSATGDTCQAEPPRTPQLLEDFGDRSGTDRTTTFTDREAHPFLKSYRRDQFNDDLNVIARHHHLYTGG